MLVYSFFTHYFIKLLGIEARIWSTVHLVSQFVICIWLCGEVFLGRGAALSSINMFPSASVPSGLYLCSGLLSWCVFCYLIILLNSAVPQRVLLMYGTAAMKKTKCDNQPEVLSPFFLLDWTAPLEKSSWGSPKSNICRGAFPTCHFGPETHVEMDLFLFLFCFLFSGLW